MQSLPLHNRFQLPDFMRGLALFGILIINIQTYALFFFLINPAQVFELGLDTPASFLPLNFAIKFLVEGQFYTVYSFLFGLSFFLLMEKYKRSGINGNQVFRRRMWILLLIGLVHALVFWFGDILHKYALLGFSLIYFNKKSVPVLYKWIAGLAIFVVLFTLIKYSFFVTEKKIEQGNLEMASMVGGFLEIWKNGSFSEVMSLQKFGVLVGHMLNLTGGFFYYIHYEIMFLLGLIAGKVGMLSDLPAHKAKLKRLLKYFLPTGLLLKALSCLPLAGIVLFTNTVYQELAVILLQFIGVPLLTISYLIIISLLFREQASGVGKWIANTGKLGLTNYLGQTLICMALFYGYIGGLSGKLTLWQTMAVAVLIYVAQVIFSNVWLHYFAQGPMEKLWSRLTMYRKKGKRVEGLQM